MLTNLGFYYMLVFFFLCSIDYVWAFHTVNFYPHVIRPSPQRQNITFYTSAHVTDNMWAAIFQLNSSSGCAGGKVTQIGPIEKTSLDQLLHYFFIVPTAFNYAFVCVSNTSTGVFTALGKVINPGELVVDPVVLYYGDTPQVSITGFINNQYKMFFVNGNDCRAKNLTTIVTVNSRVKDLANLAPRDSGYTLCVFHPADDPIPIALSPLVRVVQYLLNPSTITGDLNMLYISAMSKPDGTLHAPLQFGFASDPCPYDAGVKPSWYAPLSPTGANTSQFLAFPISTPPAPSTPVKLYSCIKKENIAGVNNSEWAPSGTHVFAVGYSVNFSPLDVVRQLSLKIEFEQHNLKNPVHFRCVYGSQIGACTTGFPSFLEGTASLSGNDRAEWIGVLPKYAGPDPAPTVFQLCAMPQTGGEYYSVKKANIANFEFSPLGEIYQYIPVEFLVDKGLKERDQHGDEQWWFVEGHNCEGTRIIRNPSISTKNTINVTFLIMGEVSFCVMSLSGSEAQRVGSVVVGSPKIAFELGWTQFYTNSPTAVNLLLNLTYELLDPRLFVAVTGSLSGKDAYAGGTVATRSGTAVEPCSSPLDVSYGGFSPGLSHRVGILLARTEGTFGVCARNPLNGSVVLVTNVHVEPNPLPVPERIVACERSHLQYTDQKLDTSSAIAYVYNGTCCESNQERKEAYIVQWVQRKGQGRPGFEPIIEVTDSELAQFSPRRQFPVCFFADNSNKSTCRTVGLINVPLHPDYCPPPTTHGPVPAGEFIPITAVPRAPNSIDSLSVVIVCIIFALLLLILAMCVCCGSKGTVGAASTSDALLDTSDEHAESDWKERLAFLEAALGPQIDGSRDPEIIPIDLTLTLCPTPEQRKKAEVALARALKEKEQRRREAEENAARTAALEAERLRQAEEAAARAAAEEAARRRQAEEEAARKAAEREAQAREAREAAARKAAEEAARRWQAEEAAAARLRDIEALLMRLEEDEPLEREAIEEAEEEARLNIAEMERELWRRQMDAERRELQEQLSRDPYWRSRRRKLREANDRAFVFISDVAETGGNSPRPRQT